MFTTVILWKSHSKLSRNKPACMFKEDRSVRLGQEGVCLREGGGNCLKYLKRGWNRKEGRGNKNFKKRSKLGQRVGTLKKRGWHLFTNHGWYSWVSSNYIIIYLSRTYDQTWLTGNLIYFVYVSFSFLFWINQHEKHCCIYLWWDIFAKIVNLLTYTQKTPS